MPNQRSELEISLPGAACTSGGSSVRSPDVTAPHEAPESSMSATLKEAKEGKAWTNDVAPQDLTRKATRGALVSTVGQVGMLVLRTGSLMVLARLLLKEDFGLVNMV